ncbi:hypothetical protein A2154_02120 [Candidatus Gottesmanbacteria bacterium RBG_16_43_7]|uniref:Transport permease protein n=1 Tax=Candidatus Gottesmanbacteria bacterium RBG_16_43_7 TaxID=1798373 RepID=A0A1F5Z8W5_9BACT|nr:MAG: hypothetical protein A2154_02120 [Candidatus Gottesmanbacteria bacterium RBG_16_43_7]
MNIYRIRGVIYKQWLTNKRDIFRIFDVFWWPAFQLFTWGLFSSYIESSKQAGSINFITLLLGGVILWTFFDRSSRDISLAFIDELWQRNFVNLFSSPLRVSEYLTGIIIVAIVKLIISAMFLFFLASVLYHFQIFRFGWYFIPAVSGLIMLGWSISLVVQGFILKFGHTVEVFIWAAAVLLQPFSCVFYPVATLPVWAQKVALFLPSTYLFENMRLYLTDGIVQWQDLWLSFGLNGLYLVGSILFFYRAYFDAKRRGYLTREF